MKFYFDYVSPNAYLAWTQLPRLIAGRNIEVEPVPVLFGAMLDTHGQRGPAEIPAKMRWMTRDILWKAKRLGVPLHPPVSHPFNPLLALRASCVSLPAERKIALITTIFEAAWANHVDISDAADLMARLDRGGFDGDSLLSRSTSPEVKNLLRTNTDSAIAAGVFGVPSMLVEQTLFWGLDDFTHLEAFLDGEKPPEEEIKDWVNLSASARRKRLS